MDRRTFLTGAVMSCAAVSRAAVKPSKLLVLGGTNYLGPAIVDYAISAGHEVTIFNRGITRPHLFPDIEKLHGDRNEGIAGLRELGDHRRWDAVIDVWPADTAMVEASAKLLVDRVGHYGFVSSIAVYRSFSEPWIDESAATRLTEPGYGGEKARTERLIAGLYPDRFAVARCPSIFGPRDPGSTLHYWLRNCSTSSEVLAPGAGTDPVQFVDVRDAGRWIVKAAVENRSGVFNTTAPPISFAELIAHCRSVTGSDSDIIWVDKDFLYERNVEAFSQMPLWIPVAEDPGFFQLSADKARRAGFTTRSPEETVAAAWRWYQSSFFNDTIFPHNGWGISMARQAELLAHWRAGRE